jgi:carboxylate-amine ligase
MRDSIRELLDFVADEVDALGSQQEMNYLRGLLNDERGTGADRQIAVYKESNGDLHKVSEFLTQQTMQGIKADDILLTDKFLRFVPQPQPA